MDQFDDVILGWTNTILMLFLSFLDNLLQDAFTFCKTVDNFEIAHKTCPILV